LKSTRERQAWLLLTPALLVYFVFLLYPMIASLGISLTNWDGISAHWKFIGLENYRHILFDDPQSRRAVSNNLIWTLVTVPAPALIGLALATLVNSNLRGRVFFRAIFYSPSVLPLVAVALVWAWIYNPQFGLLNTILRFIGLGRWTHGWLSEFGTALPATLVTAVWQGSGFPMLLYLAGLQGIPRQQYEAAELDGANWWNCFRHITLPWLRETHIIVFSLGAIYSLRAFDLIYTMTYGGPGRSTHVLSTWMYFNLFQYRQAGLGSAIAWIIVAISLLVTVPYIRIIARGRRS
jgi:raffinose/stachyose/melibiose transport system permease protein